MQGRTRVIVASIALVVVAAVLTVIARPTLAPPIWSFVLAFPWWVLVLGMIVAAALILLGWTLLSAQGRPSLRAPWQANVLTTADTIKHELDALCSSPPTEFKRDYVELIAQAIRHHLQEACKAAHGPDEGRSLGEQLVDVWTGASVETAHVNLHAAETALAQLLPGDEIEARIPEALARLQTMDVTDPRRRAAEKRLAANGTRWPSRRAAFHRAVGIGYELMDQQHARIRSFRNIALTTTVGLILLVVALCLVGARAPDAIPLCFGPPPATPEGGAPPPVQGPSGVACPSEESPPTPGRQPRRLPAPGDVTMVALLGLLGGGLSTAIALSSLQGTSTPYGVPVVLSLLKLPSGALTAIVGLLLIRGEFVPGLSQLDNQPQILAYAFFFGIAQHVVTRLVDQKAQDILKKVPSKEPTSDKPEPSLDELET